MSKQSAIKLYYLFHQNSQRNTDRYFNKQDQPKLSFPHHYFHPNSPQTKPRPQSTKQHQLTTYFPPLFNIHLSHKKKSAKHTFKHKRPALSSPMLLKTSNLKLLGPNKTHPHFTKQQQFDLSLPQQTHILHVHI